MNNKGFAISAVLYTLLISFLLFLGVTLSMFQSSSSLINNANKDLINNNELKLTNVSPSNVNEYLHNSDGSLDSNKKKWYEADTLVKINSSYGIVYWPKDVSGGYTSGNTTSGSFTKNKLSWKVVGETLNNIINYNSSGTKYILLVKDSRYDDVANFANVKKCDSNGNALDSSDTSIEGIKCTVFDDSWTYP